MSARKPVPTGAHKVLPYACNTIVGADLVSARKPVPTGAHKVLPYACDTIVGADLVSARTHQFGRMMEYVVATKKGYTPS